MRASAKRGGLFTIPVLQKRNIKLPFNSSSSNPTFSGQKRYLTEMTGSKNSILRVQDLSWLWPLFTPVCASICVFISYLALVEVIDNLLVELILELSLSGGLVAVSLGKVGCALLVWPLQRGQVSIGVNTVQYNTGQRGNKWQEINHWVIANANGWHWCVILFKAALHSGRARWKLETRAMKQASIHIECFSESINAVHRFL